MGWGSGQIRELSARRRLRRRRRRRRRHLEIQVDILARKLYLEFVPMELIPGERSGRFETGVLHRISILFIWAEWFGEPF